MPTATTTKRPMTPEQRERANAYLRQYRADHPDKVRAWRRNYILRAAARMTAASNDDQQNGGEAE